MYLSECIPERTYLSMIDKLASKNKYPHSSLHYSYQPYHYHVFDRMGARTPTGHGDFGGYSLAIYSLKQSDLRGHFPAGEFVLPPWGFGFRRATLNPHLIPNRVDVSISHCSPQHFFAGYSTIDILCITIDASGFLLSWYWFFFFGTVDTIWTAYFNPKLQDEALFVFCLLLEGKFPPRNHYLYQQYE